MSLDIDIGEIAEIFIDESIEGLDIMESGLLNLDLGAADPETMNSIFRAAHSIKGGGATFGFREISDFAHHVETLLDEMRTGERDVTRDGVDLLLQSVDCLREMITSLADGEVPLERANELEIQLEAMLNDGGTSSPADGDADGTNESSQVQVIGWRIRFAPKPQMFKSCNDPMMVLRALERLGEVDVQCTGADKLEFGKFDPEECHLAWDIYLKGSIEEEAVREAFAWVEDECDLSIEAETEVAQEAATSESQDATQPEPAAADPEPGTPLADAADSGTSSAPAKPKPKKSAAGSKSSSSKESSSIRVNIDKVDALINLVGELVITQSMLSRYQQEFDFTQLDSLRDGLTQLSRNTRELQESVMAIRMLPISFAFSRFPRLVRDTGNALGKKVDLQVVGENTELDKTVLEKIGDPLVHLVRNSLDHGLETPEERKAAGKPETGILKLNAYHESGNIVIEVSDDGAGINRDRVLEKARKQGLVGADEQLSDERISNLIFMPGFSTAEEVSDLSGRGVGMDVVRRNIADLGGNVSVKTETGVGSTFTIQLPLTLAILDGQLIRVGRESYIVPLVSIVETIQAKNERVSRVTGQAELFRLRDEYLPIVRLHEVFGVSESVTTVEDGLLVVAEAGGQRVGIFVDDLLEQQQVVIKSLEQNYRQMPGISGATILGDGKVALIIDVPGLIQLFYKHNSTDLRGPVKDVA